MRTYHPFSEEQVVGYSVADGSEWEKVEVTIPVNGATGLVRIYLPGGDVTEFQSIEYSAKSGGKKKWDFAE